MKIYTKTGDTGETSLSDGRRVPKDELRIRTYGAFDELNSLLGWILTESTLPERVRTQLLRVQSDLFQLGAELATPRGAKLGIQLIQPEQVQGLEQEMDFMETQVEPLRSFILPGGGRAAAGMHLARTVCRRAERDLISLNRGEPLRSVVLQFVNRLSDYLFVAARYLNALEKIPDQPWVAPRLE